jgi:hypothetical protein
MKSPASRFACAAALFALALSVGCETAPERHPKVTKLVVFAPNETAPDVPLGLVSAVKVVLPGPDAGSDYIWEIGSNNNKILEQMGVLKTMPAVPPATEPTTTVSFYSLKPGKSVLRFFLVRPSEQQAVPQAKCEVTVRVRE